MEIRVQNSLFEAIDVIDEFESIIWTDRYSQVGDFEIYSNFDASLLNTVKQDYYLRIAESDRTMIVEAHKITTDVDEGPHLLTTGRSLESILERRVLQEKTILYGGLQDEILRLIDENFMNTAGLDRRIINFAFETSSDPRVTTPIVDDEHEGETLYDVIKKHCDENDVGFKVILDDSNQFVFSLYAGTDHGFDQTVNPFVIFSPTFENLLSSSYLTTFVDFRNVARIGGDLQGSERRWTTIPASSPPTGLQRKEVYVDASDIESHTAAGTMPPAAYWASLRARGNQTIIALSHTEAFSGEVDYTENFIYGEDYWVGDIVQIVNEYGLEGTARITDVTFAHDASKIAVVPTFVSI